MNKEVEKMDNVLRQKIREEVFNQAVVNNIIHIKRMDIYNFRYEILVSVSNYPRQDTGTIHVQKVHNGWITNKHFVEKLEVAIVLAMGETFINGTELEV